MYGGGPRRGYLQELTCRGIGGVDVVGVVGWTSWSVSSMISCSSPFWHDHKYVTSSRGTGRASLPRVGKV